MIDFKGTPFPTAMILHAVAFYVRYAVPHRDLEEITAERGVTVDHATLNRWIVKFSPQLAKIAQSRKHVTANSWPMDETCIRVRCKGTYLYRAVDPDGQTLDVTPSGRPDLPTARRFFKLTTGTNGVPVRGVIDKGCANLAGLMAVNEILKITGAGRIGTIRQIKDLSYVLEQAHRFIKRIIGLTMGLKAFHFAAATLSGFHVAPMIRKKQFPDKGISAFRQFAALAS
ncbi:IS6 family transposase [Gemmobacter fulvus]|uniref:IS6 family transposase n=1 Tax=Gemmobacter fulvus TaxID=2840474 RepID=UPI002796BE1F|nr:IS6 family transposase [Gemmobacter fulvus]MDQ1850787.1 IS6 family transposase [Gemmobacter fulvus]